MSKNIECSSVRDSRSSCPDQREVRFVRLLLGIGLCFASSAAFAQSDVILDPRGGGAELVFAPGDYVATVSAGPWNAWNGAVGIDPLTGDLRGWLTSFSGLSSSGVAFGYGSIPYQSPGAAMANAPSVPFTLISRDTVRFSIEDPLPNDNVGYLGLSVRAVPSNPLAFSTRERFEKGWTALTNFFDPATLAALVKEGVEAVDVPGFIARLGQRIQQTLGSAVSRFTGLINQIGIGALDPNVARGVDEIYRSVTDPRLDVRGLTNTVERDMLHQVYKDIDDGLRPVTPSSSSGNRSTFVTPVRSGEVLLFDPTVAPSFIYSADDQSPLFQSFIAPHLLVGQDDYVIETLADGRWMKVGTIAPLHEFVFDVPVEFFRISNIPFELIDSSTRWISGVSFERDGLFSGSILAERAPNDTVAEPSTILLLLAAGGFYPLFAILAKRTKEPPEVVRVSATTS